MDPVPIDDIPIDDVPRDDDVDDGGAPGISAIALKPQRNEL